ncbi:NAD-dependent epimerase/dehydratase family protein [Flavobacterium sp. LB1P62]|uniref:NAD-dependent epimerase/dehydratase family protein n=1 Tax=Flavobacterium sp. LB1P62 TaxID=3401715 RepID=UPI003AAEA3C9
MKIGIIGGNSFLAKQICFKLLADNSNTKLYVFGSGLDLDFVNNEAVEFHNFIYPNSSLDYNLLAGLDAIYFCSATGVQANLIVEEKNIYGLNTFEPIQLAIALEKKNFSGKYITFGSYFEIGSNTVDKEFTEQEVIFSQGNMPNHYCNSKRMLSRYFSGNIHKINWYHFILPTIYGPSENPLRLIPYLISSILNNSPIQVTSGTQLRQYIHIDDVVDIVTKLLSYNIAPSIYNISPDTSISIKGLINTVFETTNYKADNVTIISRVDENMKYLALDNSKTKEVFNWEPKINLIEGIKTYIK